MKIFFVRHIKTKLYIPNPYGRQGRGGSHTEPTDTGDNARIFLSERSAKLFIGAWAKGKYVCDRGVSEGHPGNDWEKDYYEDVSIIPVESRNKADMEVITREIDL